MINTIARLTILDRLVALKGYSVLCSCFFFVGFLAMKTKSTTQVRAQPENSSNSNTPKPTTASNTTASSTEPDADHNEKFLAEQKQREDMWRVHKAAKRQRIDSAPTDSSVLRTSTPLSIPPVPVDETHELRAKLYSKTEECERLKKKVEELKDTNGVL